LGDEAHFEIELVEFAGAAVGPGIFVSVANIALNDGQKPFAWQWNRITSHKRDSAEADNAFLILVKDLNEAKVPAVYWSQPTPPPQDGWRLTGQVVALDEGHKAAQNVIGLGAGNKKVAVDVALADPNTAAGQPFFLIDTSDKGRHMPGAAPLALIRGFNPISLATKMVASESGVKDISQQNKIASQISKEIINSMKLHGQAPGR
jgi:hypothetical protein